MPSVPSTIIDLPRMKFNCLRQENDSLIFHMEPDRRYNPVCSYCGQPATPNRNLKRKVRDLFCFGNVTYVDFSYREVRCVRCGVVIEGLEFITPYARVTTRLAEAVGELCKYMNISEVAAYFHLDWKTVRKIDKHYIKKQLDEIPLDEVRVIGMDEVAKTKGHKYFTVIYDLGNNRLLRIVEGRSEKAVAKFFAELGENCKNIKAVAVDMWRPYTNVINEYCPMARIVYDKFHIISNYHKLIDIIRRAEFKKASQEGKDLLKGKRYLLLKNRKKLSADAQQDLEKLLESNKNLNIVYALKEQLQDIWSNVTVASFNAALDNWCELARETGIPHLEKFAESLENHRVGLSTYCLYPINTGAIEAHNITIANLRRKARGFNDKEYFKLKIFQAINLRNFGRCQV